jgi:hypothetical protein
MTIRRVTVLPLAISVFFATTFVQAQAAAEYAKHFEALSKLSVAVAKTMPADQYGFKPHPESMNFGELMAHIATTDFQFCAGLKDADPPSMPDPKDKDGYVKS